MIDPVVIQPTYMRSIGDCCICCLAMLLGRSYAEVLGACPRRIPAKRVLEEGLTVLQMINVARKLGSRLEYHDEPEDDAIGVLYLERTTGEDAHVVMYLKDIVFNPATNEIWTDVDSFLERGKWRVDGFLWRKQ